MTISNLRYIFASDFFIACLVPLLVFAVGFKILRPISVADLRDLVWPKTSRQRRSYFSLERAYSSYSRYAKLSGYELAKMKISYSRLNHANKKLGFKLGYPRKLERLEEVIQLNAVITNTIADLARETFSSLGDETMVDTGSADLGRVRESLKHFVRDWSDEGKEERTRILSPILRVLREVDPVRRAGMKVLVPGCGLGRLAWEISELGFDTTANELSFFMTLALRFLLSPETTQKTNEHILRPYAHWFSHQHSTENLFRPISFPDAVPRLGPTFRLVEQDFLTLRAPTVTPSSSPARGQHSIQPSPEGYDYIITLFFIDTSVDIFATLRQIHSLLRPGGAWINLGPLLWPGGGDAKAELSLEELFIAVEDIGFVLQTDKDLPTSPRTVECEYTGDKEAMMRWTYKAEFWVATKSK